MIKIIGISKEYIHYENNTKYKYKYLNKLNKKKQKKQALNNINLSINQGEKVAIVGLNGAGKSTFIKLLAGILTPTEGSIQIEKYIPSEREKEFLKKISLIRGQSTKLWWNLSVIEGLNIIKEIYGIDDILFQKRYKKFKKILSIDYEKQLVRSLSLGQKLKAELLASLLWNPSYLFLDEPTIGLDIVSKKKIRSTINEINEENKTTIILTSHDIADIENICSRIILLDQGKVIYDGTIKDLHDVFPKKLKIVIRSKGELNLPDRKIEKIITNNQERFEIIVLEKNIESFKNIMVENKEIYDFRIEEIPLEEVLISIYERD